MKFLASRIALLAALSMLPASAGLAQDDSQPYGGRDIENIDLSNYYSPPGVYIDSIVVTETDGRIMKGEVTVVNLDDEIVGDINFRLELLGDLGEGGAPVDTYERGAIIAAPALRPEQKHTVAFTYERPMLPAGNYYLRAQVVTSQGREYGWGEYEFDVPEDEAPHVTLRASALRLPEFEEQELEPLTGPNVDPDAGFTIEAVAQNMSDENITVTPVLDVYDFDSARRKIDSVSFDAVELEAGETRTISLDVTAHSAPGVSFGSLALMDEAGVQVSPLADFRWVIRGPHAQVMSARLANVVTGSGEIMYAFIDFVGAPDAETRVIATLDLVLSDDEGEISRVIAPDMELTDAIELGRADFQLTRDLEGSPVLTSTLSSPEGTVYHNYEIAFLAPAEVQNVALYGVIALILVLLLAGVLLYRRPRA